VAELISEFSELLIGVSVRHDGRGGYRPWRRH